MKLILVGYGKMGRMLEELLRERGDAQILGAVHPGLFESAWDVPGAPDALIDFSYPGNLEDTLGRAVDARAAGRPAAGRPARVSHRGCGGDGAWLRKLSARAR